MSPRSPFRLRSRQILDADLDDVAELLKKGFPRRSRGYWLRALQRLASHRTPEGLPKYGYLVESDNTLVGVVLLISSSLRGGAIRCNVSSWYVDPRFKSQAPLLISQALRNKDVTYLNISPALHVQPIIEAQGFVRYSSGQFVAPMWPALSRDPRVKILRTTIPSEVPLDSFDRDLLLEHARYGCISLWCLGSERAYPFVFLPRLIKRCIPCLQLIYCRELQDLVMFARPIASHLALRGKLCLIIDANGPIPKLAGKYFDGIAPRYFRGPVRPALGDLAYTEAGMFGI